MNALYTVLSIIVSYLIGSIPTGYIVARLCGIEDIRLHGSGNIGATNVARSLGIGFFIPIFLFDAAKACMNIVAILQLGCNDVGLLGAACAHLIGNGCSIFLNGQGGKGVATSVGLFAALQPYILPYVFIAWWVSFIFTKTVGLASVITIALVPLFTWGYGYPYSMVVFSLFVSVWVLLRHHANIRNALAKRY